MTLVPHNGHLADLTLKPCALAMDLLNVPRQLVFVTQLYMTEGASPGASTVESRRDPDLQRGNPWLRGIRSGLGLSWTLLRGEGIGGWNRRAA